MIQSGMKTQLEIHQPVHRRIALLLSLGVFGALAAGALLAGAAQAGRQAGHWGAREFQIQNLAGATNVVTVSLWRPDGWLITSTTYVISPAGSIYVQPNFPNTWMTATLVVDSNGPVAGAIAHLEQPPFEIGNEVYEMNSNTRWVTQARLAYLERDVTPSGTSSKIVVHAPGGTPTTATLILYGGPGGSLTSTIALVPNGAQQFNLALENRLPIQWIGSGVLISSQPVFAEVTRDNGQTYDAYLSAQDTGMELIFPWVKASDPGRVQSTVELFNPNNATAHFNLWFDTTPLTGTLLPLARTTISVPVGNGTPFRSRVSSDVPIAAMARMISQAPGAEGSMSYAAFDLADLQHTAAAPLLFDNYLGWTHQTPYGSVQIYNAGLLTATITTVYRAAGPDGLIVPNTFALGPRQIANTPPPTGIADHWSLLINSTQPVAALVVGYRQAVTADHWFAYRSRPYVPETIFPEHVLLPSMFYNVGRR
jgi:hypothetical protein